MQYGFFFSYSINMKREKNTRNNKLYFKTICIIMFAIFNGNNVI